jgi:hypothetical protein
MHGVTYGDAVFMQTSVGQLKAEWHTHYIPFLLPLSQLHSFITDQTHSGLHNMLPTMEAYLGFPHKQYSPNSIFILIFNPYSEWKAVLSECMETKLQLVTWLHDWDEVTGKFNILRLSLQYLKVPLVHIVTWQDIMWE